MRRFAAGVLGLLVLAGGTAAAKDVTPAGPTVDWIGFRPMEGGTSELFMLVTQAVTPRELVAGDRIYLMLDNVKVAKRNNTRTLDTRWFLTPVAAINIKKIGKKGCSNCAGRSKKGVQASGGVPSMPGAGLLVTIIMKPKAAPTYNTSSEQTQLDPVPPHDLRPGEKPRPVVTRTMIRVGFARPSDEVINPTQDSGRPLLAEPPTAPIKIPPAPSAPK